MEFLYGKGRHSEAEELSRGLSEEGWTSDPLLPQKWLFKFPGDAKPLFCSDRAKILVGFDEARKCILEEGGNVDNFDQFSLKLRTLGRLPEEVRATFQSGASEEERKGRLEEVGWCRSDLLPPGWLLRRLSPGLSLLTSEGCQLSSYRAALTYMENNSNTYTATDIERLRQMKRDEEEAEKEVKLEDKLEDSEGDWTQSDLLPPAWLYRLSPAGLSLLTDRGDTVTHLPLAINMIRSAGNDEDIKNFQHFLDRLENTEYAPSRLESRHSEELKKLSEQGWVENDFLPERWLCRRMRPGSSLIAVLSPERTRFTSYKSVLHHLRSSELYSDEDIERFKRFPDGVLRKRVAAQSVPRSQQRRERRLSLSHYKLALLRGAPEDELEQIRHQLRSRGWKEDIDLVPRGWMFRQRPGLSIIDFVTEKGTQLRSVTDANNYLAVNKIDFVINGKLFKEAFSDNYELELKMIEKRSKVKTPPTPLVHHTGQSYIC